MNKIIALFLSIILLLGCVGCKEDIPSSSIEPSSSISSEVSNEPIIDADPIISK